MSRKVIAVAALLGATGIMLGAFGAHGLRKIVSPEAVLTFETGVRYQIYHSLFLLLVGSLNLISDKAKNTILWLTVSGVVLFSFSIYFLALNKLFLFDFKKIGFITPIGGLLLISAWGILFLQIMRRKE